MLLVLSLLLAIEGSELIGTVPPRWEVSDWLDGRPLELESLRGRVVLVRWWTGPECPHCRAVGPYLNDWHERYGPRGLTVLGFYHHKSRGPLQTDNVRRLASALGFRFPVAVDRDWRTLRRWWLAGPERGYTSVTFLIDRSGRIRDIHPGGSYSRAEAARLEDAILDLVAERKP